MHCIDTVCCYACLGLMICGVCVCVCVCICLSVCVLGTLLIRAKTAEHLEITFAGRLVWA